MSKLVGTWELEDSENWEEFLKEVGFGLMLRKVAGRIKPTIVNENNGTQWSLKMLSTFKNSILDITEGVEFDDGIIVSFLFF
jgi:fatty acid-binding protein 3